MHRFITSLLSAALLPAAALGAGSDTTETVRPVYSVYQFEIGSSRISDTYLSPLQYSGVQYAYSYQRLQAMRFAPERWIMGLDVRLALDRDLNPARNGIMWGLGGSAQWSMMHRWTTDCTGVQLAAGGSTRVDAGMRYLGRNSNNPVSATAEWTVGPSALVNCNVRLWSLPVQLGARTDLPLLGAMFSPDYDEPYYEISLGNRSGLVHMFRPGTAFRIDQQLYADLCFGATRLRVGYRWLYSDSKLSNIVTRSAQHMFTLGLSGEWMMLNGRRKTRVHVVSPLPTVY